MLRIHYLPGPSFGDIPVTSGGIILTEIFNYFFLIFNFFLFFIFFVNKP